MNVAQEVTDALLRHAETRTNKLQSLESLCAVLVAAVAELDARTAKLDTAETGRE